MNSLTETMRKAPLTRQTVEQFRNQALQVVDQAIDVFFKPEREVAEGKVAYDQLTDLERSLRAYQGRLGQECEQLNQAYTETVTFHSGKGHKPGDTSVGAAASLLPEGQPLKNGTRRVGYVSSRAQQAPDITRESQGLERLVNQMGSVLPLYGSVAMVPGPLSVSLKDHLKETLSWAASGSSHSQSSLEQESFRLLSLSAGQKSTCSGSSGHTSQSGRASSSTADERVMPGLHQIRNAVASLGFVEGLQTDYRLSQDVTEWERTTTERGFFFKEKVTSFQEVNRGQLEIETGRIPLLPDRLAPGALRTNAGLEDPRAGSELVDLVEKSELNPEFLDRFRDQALAVIDQAVGTLFNTQRETSQGRESYDRLSNLGRALELAQSRFGDRYSQLPEQIQKLAEVTPLYACVAMVPGEMSSSVKNHAKEIFEFASRSTSGGGSRTHEESVSLLGSLSETRGSSSHFSEFTSSLRRETTTTDERIMPRLHELKVQLDQMQINENGRLVIQVSKAAR